MEGLARQGSGEEEVIRSVNGKKEGNECSQSADVENVTTHRGIHVELVFETLNQEEGMKFRKSRSLVIHLSLRVRCDLIRGTRVPEDKAESLNA